MRVAQVLAGKRLIVIDDNPIVRMGVQEILRRAGAIVVRSLRDTADGAVLDIGLTGGLTATPIAEALSSRNVPFLFYTGQPEAIVEPIRVRWPGCKIILKPSNAQEIVAAVMDLTERPATGVLRPH